MKKSVLVGLVILIVAGGYVAWAQPAGMPTVPQGVACTMEAKLCPDGSYVGRSGPKCEFTACPSTSIPMGATADLTLQVGGTASAFGVSITVGKVLEDSRCPIDVQCIQAGTVRVKTQLVSALGTAEQIFTLNKSITTEAETITLVEVSPAPHSKQTIGSSEYVFTFEIKKRL